MVVPLHRRREGLIGNGDNFYMAASYVYGSSMVSTPHQSAPEAYFILQDLLFLNQQQLAHHSHSHFEKSGKTLPWPLPRRSAPKPPSRVSRHMPYSMPPSTDPAVAVRVECNLKVGQG